jgi:hypothetical protein
MSKISATNGIYKLKKTKLNLDFFDCVFYVKLRKIFEKIKYFTSSNSFDFET